MDPSDSIHGGIDSNTEIYTRRGKTRSTADGVDIILFNTYYDRYFPNLNAHHGKMRTLMSLFWRGSKTTLIYSTTLDTILPTYYFHIFFIFSHVVGWAPRWRIGWPPHHDMCPCFHDKSQEAAVTSRRIDRERDCVAPCPAPPRRDGRRRRRRTRGYYARSYPVERCLRA